MANSDRAIDIGAWVLENGHRTLLRLTGGRYPRTVSGMQPVELHARGRKSGQLHATLLTAPICEENRVVLIASRGGHTENPQWYKNLVVNPEVEITIDGHTRPMRARTADKDEKAALWPTIVKVNPGYGQYQRDTQRDIPVVICEPV